MFVRLLVTGVSVGLVGAATILKQNKNNPKPAENKTRTDDLKVINDPIHGTMTFDPVLVAIMDTPQFQRLRDIKQLGGGYYVYPGASHNRFEHSLGVCHLAGELLDELKAFDQTLDITDLDRLMVQIAGLCHDMGHGPFSHTFDNQFIPEAENFKPKGDKPEAAKDKFQHETLSLKMFDYMIEENEVLKKHLKEKKIYPDKINVIKALIHSEGNPGEKFKDMKGKEFLFEVVANKRNGVDVDKWDYFKRDALYLGIPTAFDHKRMMKFCRVIEVDGEKQICLRDKEAFNLYEMFITRQNLHRKAYQHKTVKAVESMIVNGLLAADDEIKLSGKDGSPVKLSDCVNDEKAFTKLTDSVFYQILASDNPKLKSARAWMEAVQKRQIYRLVAETSPITDPVKDPKEIEKDIVMNISQEKRSDLEEIEPFKHPRCPQYRFIVQVVTLDFGKKGRNPIDDYRFYRKGHGTKAESVKASQISKFLPKDNVAEKYVRVLLRPTDNKDKDEKCYRELLDGFKKWYEKTFPEYEPKVYGWTYDGYKDDTNTNDAH